MRGLQFSGSNILVRGNTLRNIARTGIFFGGVKSGRITGNTMSDSNSTHGNGISTYLQDDQIIVDHNTVVDANIAFTMEESSNITVTENVFDGAGNTTAVFADWGGMTGANKITHNTIIGSSNHSALQVLTKTGATFDIEYNILDGGPYGSNMTTANNVYVGLGWGQSSAYGWVLGPGESTATLAQVFVHPGTRDYTTTTLYAAYGATTPINNVASAYAAGDLWASLWSAVQSMFTQLVHFFTHFGGT
jgi:parallel beta-helix repeat protein